MSTYFNIDSDNIHFSNKDIFKIFNLTKKVTKFFSPFFFDTSLKLHKTLDIFSVDFTKLDKTEIKKELLKTSNNFLSNPKFSIKEEFDDKTLFEAIQRCDIDLINIIIFDYLCYIKSKYSILNEFVKKQFGCDVNFHDEDEHVEEWNEFYDYLKNENESLNFKKFLKSLHFKYLNKILNNEPLDCNEKILTLKNLIKYIFYFYQFKFLSQKNSQIAKIIFCKKESDKKVKNYDVEILDSYFFKSYVYDPQNYRYRQVEVKKNCVAFIGINNNIVYYLPFYNFEKYFVYDNDKKTRTRKCLFYKNKYFNIIVPGTILNINGTFSKKINPSGNSISMLKQFTFLNKLNRISVNYIIHPILGKIE